MKPLKRFLNLLKLDKKDVLQLFFYAMFSGLISLTVFYNNWHIRQKLHF